MDLPSQGIDYYLDYLLTLQEVHPKRAFFLSLVGMSPDETYMLLEEVRNSGFSSITGLNLSCSNIPGEPQITYDFETTKRILSETFGYFDKPLDTKLPPYFGIVHFDQAAEVFNRHPLKFVNCVNSIGSGIYIEDESVIIHPKNDFDGISGQYIKSIALTNVHAFYQGLDPPMRIVGTGGVYNDHDAFEYILCGASIVQIGTALHQQGVDIFERISLELKAIVAQRDYEEPGDFKDRLKYLA